MCTSTRWCGWDDASHSQRWRSSWKVFLSVLHLAFLTHCSLSVISNETVLMHLLSMQQYCNVLVLHGLTRVLLYAWTLCVRMGMWVLCCYPGFLLHMQTGIYECWNWSSVSQDLCNICTNKYKELTGVCHTFCSLINVSCGVCIIFSVQWTICTAHAFSVVLLGARIFILFPRERKYYFAI